MYSSIYNLFEEAFAESKLGKNFEFTINPTDDFKNFYGFAANTSTETLRAGKKYEIHNITLMLATKHPQCSFKDYLAELDELKLVWSEVWSIINDRKDFIIPFTDRTSIAYSHATYQDVFITLSVTFTLERCVSKQETFFETGTKSWINA